MSKATFNKSLRAAAEQMQREAREKQYKYDPVLWAEEVLGAVLWSKQKEILRSIVANKRTAVKSCHSIGKTYLCAIACCWWVSTRQDSMIQSTAPTYQQVHAQLWEEIRKMHIRGSLVGEVGMNDKWTRPPAGGDRRAKPTLVGEGKKPADSNIHGFHGTHRPDGVFAILDEACGIAVSIFTGSEAITTADFDRILATGNPDDPNTEFGRIFREDKNLWNFITVSAYDTPNFTGEAEELREWAAKKDKGDPEKTYTQKVERLLEGMPKPTWIEERREAWGEDDPRFISKVLAQFPTTSADSLFSAADIEVGKACTIDPANNPTAFRVLAVDVARYGADKTVMILNVAGHIEVIEVLNTSDTMEVAALAHKWAIEHNVDQVRVDGVGVGGGVVDRLTQLARSVEDTYVVVEMTANASPPDRTLHRNARAYWYDSAKSQMRNDLIDLPYNPDNDADWGAQLIRELGSIMYGYPNGILQIESKEDIRRRGEHSPDFVDALVMATAPISYLTEDPLASYRAGQVLPIDLLRDTEMVSLY